MVDPETGGVTADGSTNGNRLTQSNEDRFVLYSSNNPDMALVTSSLDGNNFLSWSRAIKLALGAKDKLGFIDGTFERPDVTSPDYVRWNRIACMIISWILNSISKEIAEAFIYTASARQLWLDLEERFGESNGPLIYQLQLEISSAAQGNVGIAKYHTRLKKLWDELSCIIPTPQCTCGKCTCGVSKRIFEQSSSIHVVQFLMGLSDGYDHVRNQLLVMDPLPSTNKAYSMLQCVEKHKEVQLGQAEIIESNAMAVRVQTGKRTNNKGKFNKKKRHVDKSALYCEHCDRKGHSKESCFKIHRYPDWYKDLLEQKKKDGEQYKGNVANAVEADDDKARLEMNLSEMIKQENMKLMKGKGPADPMVNFAHLHDFAGPED